MKQPTPFWWDMWMEGLSTAGKLAETMAAVPMVMGRRLSLIDAANRNPIIADYPELCRMVAEEMEAGTQAAMSLMRNGQEICVELAAAYSSCRLLSRRDHDGGRNEDRRHKAILLQFTGLC